MLHAHDKRIHSVSRTTTRRNEKLINVLPSPQKYNNPRAEQPLPYINDTRHCALAPSHTTANCALRPSKHTKPKYPPPLSLCVEIEFYVDIS